MRSRNRSATRGVWRCQCPRVTLPLFGQCLHFVAINRQATSISHRGPVSVVTGCSARVTLCNRAPPSTRRNQQLTHRSLVRASAPCNSNGTERPRANQSQLPDCEQGLRTATRHNRMRLLKPKIDVVFKLLFAAPRHEPLLIASLTAVLQPATAITSAIVLNPEIPKDFTSEKAIILDVRVQLSDGRRIDVEMQARRKPAFRERVLYYWARNFGAQLEIGEEYQALSPCVGVYVLDFSDLQGHDFHSVFKLCNRSTVGSCIMRSKCTSSNYRNCLPTGKMTLYFNGGASFEFGTSRNWRILP